MDSSAISQVAESLYAVAHSLISHDISHIEKVCKEHLEEHQSFDKEKRNEVGFEFIAFYLHLIWRQAHNLLGEDESWELKKAQELIFCDRMMSTLKGGMQDSREELESSLRQIVDERHLEYAEYKTFPKTEDEGLKDTLFWEFGKHVCEAAGYPMDIFIIIAACSVAFGFAKAPEWKEILSQAK